MELHRSVLHMGGELHGGCTVDGMTVGLAVEIVVRLIAVGRLQGDFLLPHKGAVPIRDLQTGVHVLRAGDDRHAVCLKLHTGHVVGDRHQIAGQGIVVISVFQMGHGDPDRFLRIHVTHVQDQHALIVRADLLIYVTASIHRFVGIGGIKAVVKAVGNRNIFTLKSIGADLTYRQLPGGSCQIQSAQILLCRDDRPVFGHPHIGVVGVGGHVLVVALHPGDQRRGAVCFQTGVQNLGGILGSKGVFKLSGVAVVSDTHDVGVNRQIAPCGCVEDFPVYVQVFPRLFAVILLGLHHSVFPEVAGIVGIGGGLNVLGGVEAEPVHAGVDAFHEQRKHPLLHIGVGGVQIRQVAVGVVLGLRAGAGGGAVVVEGHADAVHVFVAVAVDNGLILLHGGGDGGGAVRLLALVVGGGQMVRHYVHQDADAVFLRLAAQSDQLVLGAQGGIVSDGEAQRLIEGPPGGAAPLGLLHRHGQHILEAGVPYALQIHHDLMVRPVKGVKRQSVLRVFGQSVHIGVREIHIFRQLRGLVCFRRLRVIVLAAAEHRQHQQGCQQETNDSFGCFHTQIPLLVDDFPDEETKGPHKEAPLSRQFTSRQR